MLKLTLSSVHKQTEQCPPAAMLRQTFSYKELQFAGSTMNTTVTTKHNQLPYHTPQQCACSGYSLLRDPHHNKGLAFSEKERDAHYLRGLLPPTVVSQDLQVKKMMYNLRQYQVPLQKYMAMMDLQEMNEKLFFKLLINSGEKLLQSLLMLPGEKAFKYLKIKGCGDLISLQENWSRVLVSLEGLVIEDCCRLVSLEDESYPKSSCLIKLKISKLPKLVYLPQWIRNSTKLQILDIEDCEGLIEVPDWFWELTSLRVLRIVRCSNLKSLPDGMQSLTALEFLVIEDCKSLMSWPNGFGSLVSLNTVGFQCTSHLPSLPEELQQLTALRRLIIINCQTMLALPEWLLNFTSLQKVFIFGCKNLQGIPDWFPKLTALQELDIRKCDELTPRCQKPTGVDWPKIAHIPLIFLNRECIQEEA